MLGSSSATFIRCVPIIIRNRFRFFFAAMIGIGLSGRWHVHDCLFCNHRLFLNLCMHGKAWVFGKDPRMRSVCDGRSSHIMTIIVTTVFRRRQLCMYSRAVQPCSWNSHPASTAAGNRAHHRGQLEALAAIAVRQRPARQQRSAPEGVSSVP